MALLHYKVPMVYASWSWRELAAALGCAVSPDMTARARLREQMESLLGEEVSLWASGRAALEEAFRAIARVSGDRREALMPSLLCRSVAERALAAGLQPRFYDIGEDLTPDLARAREGIGRQTACVVVPHLYGRVLDLEPITGPCRAAGVHLIEDCAASFLLRMENGALSGRQADFAVFSFNTGKTLVAGGGGALIQRAGLPAAAPETWSTREERKHAAARLWFALSYAWPSAGYSFLHRLPWRRWGARAPQKVQGKTITAVDASVVMVQWQRWPQLLARRLEIQGQYASGLANAPGIRLPQYAQGRYLTRLFVEFPVNVNDSSQPRYPVRELLHARGIQTHLPYPPLHLDPQFGGPRRGDCPVSEQVAARCLAVPSHPGLRHTQVEWVCRAIREIAQELAESKLHPVPAEAASITPEAPAAEEE